ALFTAANKAAARNAIGVSHAAPNITRRARVIDFHFGAARGVGFVDGKDAGTLSYTLAAPISKGDMSFQYSGSAPPSQTLVVFLGIDGEYYTNTIRSVSGGVAAL